MSACIIVLEWLATNLFPSARVAAEYKLYTCISDCTHALFVFILLSFPSEESRSLGLSTRALLLALLSGWTIDHYCTEIDLSFRADALIQQAFS